MSSNSALAMLSGMSAITSIVSLALLVFTIVCYWKIFKKMGEAGWKAIIPIYNNFIIYKRTWSVKFFLLMIVFLVVGLILTLFSTYFLSSGSGSLSLIGMVLSVVAIAMMIASVVINFVSYYKLVKAFGQSAIIFVLMLFIQPVALAILAFGSARYVLGGIDDGGYNNDDYDAEEDFKNTQDAMNNMIGASVVEENGGSPEYHQETLHQPQYDDSPVYNRVQEDNYPAYNEGNSDSMMEVNNDVDISEEVISLEMEDEEANPSSNSFKLSLSKEEVEEKKTQVNNTLNLHIIE